MATKGILTEDLLENLKSITLANREFVANECTSLSPTQLKWRVSKESWNIQEILSHINSFSDYYNDLFVEKIKNSRKKVRKEYFISSPLGKSAWRSMKLGRANNVRRKLRAIKPYNPSFTPELVTEDAVERFIQSQNEMFTILDNAKTANLKKNKIQMSKGKLIRLRLGDALMFVVYHAERHIQQVKNSINHPNFPKEL